MSNLFVIVSANHLNQAFKKTWRNIKEEKREASGKRPKRDLFDNLEEATKDGDELKQDYDASNYEKMPESLNDLKNDH